MISTNEERKDRAERIWRILTEFESPGDALLLLSSVLAGFAFQNAYDPKQIKIAVLELVKEALELNGPKEGDDEPDDAT